MKKGILVIFNVKKKQELYYVCLSMRGRNRNIRVYTFISFLDSRLFITTSARSLLVEISTKYASTQTVSIFLSIFFYFLIPFPVFFFKYFTPLFFFTFIPFVAHCSSSYIYTYISFQLLDLVKTFDTQRHFT